MTTAVKIENLSKKYIIGHQREKQYETFRDVLMHKFRGMGHRVRHPLSANQEEIKQEDLWALRDINLEIHQGERVGIIGRNGAGKSTLLKVLSRITEPTQGRFSMNGRVASLLEVGTGFHPELSGRENIFLNGAILGMGKVEIKRKFDEIVAFAETEKFLDTPVKRYSSGMYVRLAFAVAAHLEPEILLVDEVLAVGDASFQKKCLGKMEDVAKEGRTILFVSHNMGSINKLCGRTIWIKNGQIEMDGATEQVMSLYLTDETSQDGQATWEEGISNKGVNEFNLTACRIKNGQNKVTTSLDARKDFSIELEYEILESLPFCRVGFKVLTTDGITVFASYDTDNVELTELRKPGRYISTCIIPAYLLNTGRYLVSVAAGNARTKTFVHLPNILSFDIFETGSTGSEIVSKREGVVRPKLAWQKLQINSNVLKDLSQ